MIKNSQFSVFLLSLDLPVNIHAWASMTPSLRCFLCYWLQFFSTSHGFLLEMAMDQIATSWRQSPYRPLLPSQQLLSAPENWAHSMAHKNITGFDNCTHFKRPHLSVVWSWTCKCWLPAECHCSITHEKLVICWPVICCLLTSTVKPNTTVWNLWVRLFSKQFWLDK